MYKFLMISAAVVTLANCSHGDKNHNSEASTPVENTASGPTKAHAVFKAANGQKLTGMVHFTEENGTMKVETRVEGIKPGPHGYHIHEVGDCSAKDFSTAGGHFNPEKTSHGALDSEHRHVGDMGNLVADKKGKAYSTLNIKGMTMVAGDSSIIGKAVIIHKDRDDLKSQPTGDSGSRIGCAIIEAL